MMQHLCTETVSILSRGPSNLSIQETIKGVNEDCILRLNALLDGLIFSGRTQTSWL